MTLQNDFHAMVEYASKAPSGHNTQPWFFTLGADAITITPDFSKRLPVVDPDDRELFISLGCAAENLRIAANHYGYATTTAVSAAGTITIHLDKQPGAQLDPLFAQIPLRQTNRARYDGRNIPQALLDGILAAAQSDDTVRLRVWDKNAPQFAQLAELVMDGNRAQLGDEAFKRELLSWIRFNKAHSERTLDGLSYAVMGAPNLPAWMTKPIIRLALKANAQNKADGKKIASASHLLLLATDDDTIPTWIAAGAVLQRLLLLLTEQGIASAWLNQPCEVAELRARLGRERALGGQYPQLLLRLGYAAPLPYAKRKPVEAVIREAS